MLNGAKLLETNLRKHLRYVHVHVTKTNKNPERYSIIKIMFNQFLKNLKLRPSTVFIYLRSPNITKDKIFSRAQIRNLILIHLS